MIEKMKFVSLTGPTDDIDRVVNNYLSKYEIHLENALTEWNSAKGLKPYVEANPYKDMVSRSSEVVSLLSDKTLGTTVDMNVDTANRKICTITDDIHAKQHDIAELEKQISDLQTEYDHISPFIDLKCDMAAILGFKNIKYRFGRIPKESYGIFEEFSNNNPSLIYIKSRDDGKYVWCLYFVPLIECDKVDAICTSLHFEETFIPDPSRGTPQKVCADILAKLDELNTRLSDIKSELAEYLVKDKDVILSAHQRIRTAYENFDVRKMAAKTNADGTTFYIICGWISKSDADALADDLTDDKDVICIFEEPSEHHAKKPPTKLKNPAVFRPFEMYVKMYGLPDYSEFDPTIFVAITYSFIFGIMFGDVGQGLCLFIGGLILYKVKKMDLAAIISCAGIFSTIFGFMFGSIFGFEDIIKPIWLRPAENISKMPLVGSLNTIFIFAIILGMGIILISMVFNIINRIISKDTGNMLFDTNGVAGFVFYAAAISTIILYMTGHTLPATAVLVIMFIIPLILIALKEPLTHLIKKNDRLIEGGVGMFLTQTFFELFEVLLSYFSNTLSFVRVGAFAVSHAAMMEVVMMLAGAESGSPNIVVIVLGNLLVMGMEGLIVGIQVLRLEFYEMFSRFYSGTGREFKPFRGTR